MPSNILNIAFRRTLPILLSGAIKQYISTKYDQHPNMFTQDLEDIDELRKTAINAFEPHSSGIRKLQAYAAQLVWIGSKFPIDIGVDFTWYPSLGYHTEVAVSQNNIRFELANILFNLAVLYCQLAFFSPRGSPDGLKAASNYFCAAAGVLSHLKTSVIPDMRAAVPEDMDSMTLESLEQLMLAQAQECFWQKAVKDGLKDASIAKLAIKVSDLYAQAADFGIKSPAISSEWIHHMNAKQHHFAAAAQFRAACDALEKRRYGEEVARLQASLIQAAEALKESRYISSIVLQDAQGLRNKVQDDLRRAEKDNDLIYLSPVPAVSELRALDRASMVSPKVPKEVAEPVVALGENSDLGRPLFTKLVPYSVHIASSIYASRRDETIKAIVDEMEALTARIHGLLSSLNLPGAVQALEKPLGLPPGLVSHAEELRQQKGPSRLQQMMSDVDTVKTNDRQTYEEGISFLRSEAEDDEKARMKNGTDRWSRPSSNEVAQSLYDQAQEIDGYLQKAASSDATVKDKVRENEYLITLLAGTDRDLEEFVPSSRHVVMTSQLEREVGKLRTALNDINRLEGRRKRKIESLKMKGQADDVNSELYKEAGRLEREYPMQKVEAAQFEDFFDERLRRYDSDRNMLTDEQQEQSQYLARLTEANNAFLSIRRGDTSTKDRERALQKLENAYFAYREIVQNLDVGRKFYNDLGSIVCNFRDACRTLATQRRSEAEQLEADILTVIPMANLNIATTGQQAAVQETHRLSDVAHMVARSGRQSGAQTEPPLPAPVPVKPPTATVASNGRSGTSGPVESRSGTWNPELGIRFSGQQASLGGRGNNGGAVAGGQVGKARPKEPPVWDPTKGVKFG